MLLSILLSTTLLFVSFSIGASYERAQQLMAKGMAGEAQLSVKAVDNLVDIVDISDIAGVEASAFMLEGKALYHENGYYESVDFIAADLSELDEINPPRLKGGKEIPDFNGDQVILPDRFTSKYGIKEGDVITFEIGGASVKLTVGGVAAYDTVFLRHTRGVTALLPIETMRKLMDQPKGFNEVLIKVAADIKVKEVEDELRENLPDEKFQVTQIVDEMQIQSDARQKSMPFFLISFFSLTMSIFIIYSSYKVIILDRLPVIGTFRSIGATKKTVAHILFLESLIYGVTGGVVGIPVGILILKFILRGMGRSLSQGMEIPIVVAPMGIILSFGMAVVVSLFSAWMPVYQASRLSIKEVVLGKVEEKQFSRRSIIIMGILLWVISIILPRIASGKMLYVAGGLSLLGLIASTIMIIPLVTNCFAKGLEHIYRHIFGNEGQLAARNMRDNKNISQNITLLFISLSAVIAITVVGNFVTSYVCDVFRGAALQGFADGPMSQQFVEQVEQMDGAKKVLPCYVFEDQISINGETATYIQATDDIQGYSDMLALHYSAAEMKGKAVQSFEGKRAILFNEDYMKRRGLSVGNDITLQGKKGEKHYSVVGSFKSRATDVQAIIPSKFAEADFGADQYDFLAYTAADPEAVMVQIRALFGDTSNWSRTVEEFNTDALSTVGAFLKPMHSMTYFILLLATLGIINNLLVNYIQRKHTIAMYKAIGLSNRQHLKMTIIEGFSSGLIGAVIAIIISYMEIKTIFIVAGPKIASVPELDSRTFLIAGLMGILITLAGSIVPLLKSDKMSVVEEIKVE